MDFKAEPFASPLKDQGRRGALADMFDDVCRQLRNEQLCLIDGFAGPGAYSVIVRVYFGSPPTRSARVQAQRAIEQLELPLPR